MILLSCKVTDMEELVMAWKKFKQISYWCSCPADSLEIELD